MPFHTQFTMGKSIDPPELSPRFVVVQLAN
jgi:hypothetical protein